MLEDESLYEEGDWVVGNAILTVCRNILHVHNTKSVTVGVSFILLFCLLRSLFILSIFNPKNFILFFFKKIMQIPIELNLIDK